jgi:hypothetical protein
MQKLTITGAAVLLAATAISAGAQTRTIPGRTESVTATVEAIDHGNRAVTVKKPDGTYEVFYVPEGIKRFDTLKIGDKVTAKYYENVVLQVHRPGQKDVNSASAGIVKNEAKGAGTVSRQRTITATITALDPKVPSITFSGPNGWKYSTKVQDKNAIAAVKVGDKVDITWTEAMILALESAQ